MKKSFLLAALFGVLSEGSSFSATTLKDAINNIKSDVVNFYNNIDGQFNNVITGWNHSVSFSGSLQEHITLLEGAFNALDLTNVTNLDVLAPSSTNGVRDGTYTTANKVIRQLIKGIGYTSLDSPITGWELVAAPVSDVGKPMSMVSQSNSSFFITIDSHNYDCPNSSLPTTIRAGMNIIFSNPTYGNIVFQYKGTDLESSTLANNIAVLSSVITNWSLVSASRFAVGYSMSGVTNESGTFRITVNSKNYDCLASSLPATITVGTIVVFRDLTTIGSAISLQYTGFSFLSRSNLPSSLLTNGVNINLEGPLSTLGISFVLPTSIYDATNGIAKIASRSDTNIGFLDSNPSHVDTNFAYSAAQRLAEALHSVA